MADPTRIDRHTVAAEDVAEIPLWLRTHGASPRAIPAVVARARASLALPQPTDPDALEAIWRDGRTWSSCHGCGRSVAAVARVGEEPDYESSTARLCRDCLLAALALLPEGVEVAPPHAP